MGTVVLLAALAACLWRFHGWLRAREADDHRDQQEAAERAACWACAPDQDPITHRLRHRPAPRGAEPL